VRVCSALGIALGTGMVNSTAYVAWINEEDGAGYVVSYYMTGAYSDPTLCVSTSHWTVQTHCGIPASQPNGATTCCPPAKR